MTTQEFSRLLSPIQIGGKQVRNRFMLTTHNPKMNDERYLAYLEERVKGGVGLVGIPILHETVSSINFINTGKVVPAYAGDGDGTPDPESEEGAAYFDETLIPRLRARADIVHRHGAYCFGQIANRGSIRLPDTFQPMVSPSGLADDHVRMASHELTTDEVRRIVKLFARSAERIKKAGLDGAEIHCTHGYLVEQFLSPATNRRTDRYGGSAENRMRFLLEIIDEIKTRCGDDFPIGVRISGYQDVEGGMTTEDIKAVVKRITNSLAYVNVTAGTIGALQKGVVTPYVASSFIPSGFNVPAASRIKEVCTVPLIVTGRINDPWQMEGIIANGHADMIGLTRALIADPHLPRKLAEGRAQEVRKCAGLNECHFPDRVSSCPVNPMAGRELDLKVQLIDKPKRVLIVGGGPAGLEAARIASARGHQVTLVEKSDQLGGTVATLARDPSRREMITLIDTLKREIREQGVEVLLNTEATPEFVAKHKPDATVLAIGSTPVIPDVPGVDTVPVFNALEILDNPAQLGRRVLVVGGLMDGQPPVLAALYLAEQGKEVTLLSENVGIGQGLEWSIQHFVLKRLLEKNVRLMPLTELIEAGRVPRLRNVFTKQVSEGEEIDSIVFACGSAPRSFPQIEGEVYRIGDCLAPRRLLHATLDGARIGVRL
ncbi:FAD-dependent oxidoreductase [Caldimonas thermodepolymerans]|jgi:NADH:flavin oxidoreductases, Old Yellow Enzyme family|nr:FAD-dependent oxidoreductase [Caldimonas thermodepolymerans]QPC31221.1 FAD-dependent oxidoreductase [Caldimonas thermodepolymerans]RDH96681.1 2,4-dienoyl-CoA reductase (NADPH2) [Caldimonas thermodepolymerans]TCP04721.1 2,4-dienoyl-CoA reductase (NADPH2) [Caldimonas thermodepolymerans]UZG43951.1 FAD-dependent oxidoreductase [Caldimonas thermodepolymerans]UZG47619.1 FAD-dependent oxidoreductase [Caldimonas thermodepolymerans]